MKHLKKFNEKATENYGEFAKEIRDFCETNLAYLLDDYKFQLKVDKNADATLKLNQEGTILNQNINMGTTTKIDITQK